MEHNWQRNIFDSNHIDSNQQQPQNFGLNSNSNCINNMDLNSVIGDFMQNEQYPYNLNFNDNLTELSPEETEQFLEDAFSLSSKSPLSDDLTESSLSLQDSPGEPNMGEDYLYFSNVSDAMKQEELSPTTTAEHQFDNIPPPAFVPVSIQNTDGVNHATTDVQSVLQQHLIAPSPPQNISAFLQQSDDMPLSNINDNIQGSHNFNQVNVSKENLASAPMNLISNAKGCSNQQAGSLLKLLQANTAEQDSIAIKQRQLAKKKALRAKRQKAEAKSPPQEKNEYGNEANLQKSVSVSKEEIKCETSRSAPAPTVSQVVMIPQVVFTNGNGDHSTSQPITAILTAPSKQVMTTVPIQILSASSGELDKIPINPIGKKALDVSNKRKAEKGGRKTNHNEVEKRYRESITTSLEDLKELVFGSETKSTKAGILRKAMEHIKYLRKINQRLKQENMRLKMAQKQTTLVDLVQNHTAIHNLQQNTIEDFGDQISSEEEDMELLEEEVQSNSTLQSPSSTLTSPVGVESVQGNGTFGLVSKQRFFLSMFMFAFMFLGPGKLLFGTEDVSTSDYKTPHTGGRTILSYGSDTQEDRFKAYTGMIVNCVIYLLFFAWLLIKGEPRYSQDSKNVASYKMYMAKADMEMTKGDLHAAALNIERGLNVIGRPWSSSLIDNIPSLIWHAFCHMLHQLGLLSLIKNFGWMILPRRLSLEDSKARYHNSCAMAGEAYLKLLQLAMLDTTNKISKLTYAKLALAAINLMECAGNAVSSEDVLKVYLNAVVMLRIKFGGLWRLVMRYLVNRSKSLLSYRADSVPDILSWVFHPIGSEYLLYGPWQTDISPSNQGPLHQVRCSFFMTQIKATVKQLMAPANADIDIKESERQLSLLKQRCFSADKVFIWWHDLLSTAFYIGVGMNSKARETWETISDINDIATPYANDLYDLIDCYFDARDGADKAELEARLSMVEDNIAKNFIFDEGKSKQDELFQLLAVTCADMALTVRVTNWEQSSLKNTSVDQLVKFEQDLNILNEFNMQNRCLRGKIQYFEEVSRVMAGANPISLRKQLLKRRNQKQNGGSIDSCGKLKNEEFQEAKTLLFVLKHLPSVVISSYPKSFVSQLQKAGQVLEKSGLMEMTEDCKKILATIKTM